MEDSTTPPKLSTSNPPSIVNIGTCGAHTGGKAGYASTTHYYDGNVGACGCSSGGKMALWQTSPADRVFTAAGSQNLFDSSSSSWCGNGCGKCYELTNVGHVAATGQGRCTGGGDSIIVMITNLCPADGNEVWCSQPKNQYGYRTHFDIMNGDGGPMGWGESFLR